MKIQLPEWLLGDAAKVRRRVERMSVQEMATWVDVAGSEMSRAMREYAATRREDDLAELERGVATLVAMITELRARHD